MTNAIEKRYTTALDAVVNTRAQREKLVLNGVISETVGWWQIARALHSTKQAIAGSDKEYDTIKTDKAGNEVYQKDGKMPVIVTQTFKSYCEDTFSEAGLSRSRREELVTAYITIEQLKLAGFGVEDLPKVVNHATLLAKWDLANQESVWQEFLDTLDVNVLRQPKEVVNGEESETESEVEEAEIVEDKPLEFFMQQFIDRVGDREIGDEALAAVLAEQIIKKIEHLTYEVKDAEEEA